MDPTAVDIGTVLLERSPAFVTQEELEAETGKSGYAIRWYIYQLREAGYVIDAIKLADPAAFAAGKRGWKLSDVRSESYRPADHVKPEPEPAIDTLRAGVRVLHPKHGKGRVEFSCPTASAVVVRFGRKIERISRESLAIVA